MINYWRFENAPPAGARSMRLSSFTWTPLGGEGSAQPPVPTSSSVVCPRLSMSPRRVALHGRRRNSVINWTGAVRLVVQRRARGGRFSTVGELRRVRARRLRFSGRVGGRRLRPGRYRLVGRSNCAEARLSFRVVRG